MNNFPENEGLINEEANYETSLAILVDQIREWSLNRIYELEEELAIRIWQGKQEDAEAKHYNQPVQMDGSGNITTWPDKYNDMSSAWVVRVIDFSDLSGHDRAAKWPATFTSKAMVAGWRNKGEASRTTTDGQER